MKNILRTAIIIVFAAISATACYDSKDNYKYGEEVTLQINGLKESYDLTAFVDVLKIDPQITTNSPSPTLEYTWTVLPSNYRYNETTVTISQDAILEYPVTLTPDNYTLTLDVHNTTNGQRAHAQALLTVVNDFSRGFYLLKESSDGGTEMDLHLPDGRRLDNLIEQSLGYKLTGSPVSMGLSCFYPFLDEQTAEYQKTKALGVCTSDGISIFNVADMHEIYNHNTMFYTDPPEESPLYFTFCYYGTAYLSNRGIYFSTSSTSLARPGSGKFGYRKAPELEYRPTIHSIFDRNFYFFDELNGRFFFINHNGHFNYITNENGTQTEHSPIGIPHELLHLGRNKVGKSGANVTGYAVFKDRSSSKRYLYHLAFAGKTDNPLTQVDEIEGMSFNNAECYGTNELDSHIIYFSVGGQLYYYDIMGGTEHTLNPNGFGGEQIVFIRNKFWRESKDEDYNFNYVVIGTYNAGKYKVYMYNTVGGIPTGSPVNILEGDGKALHMQYVSPIMDNTSLGSTSYYPGSY